MEFPGRAQRGRAQKEDGQPSSRPRKRGDRHPKLMKKLSANVAAIIAGLIALPLEAGTITYQAIAPAQSDTGCGISDENHYTTAVDGGNATGTNRTLNGITLFALAGSGPSSTADNCTLNALSGSLTNGNSGKTAIQVDGTFKDILSDTTTVKGAGDNTEQEVALDPASLEKGVTYDLRVYVCPSSGENRQVNLSFVGDEQDAVETGFFNEDDATTSAGRFNNRNQVYYINYRYTWDGDTTPGITITQKSGAAPFCLSALTNQMAEESGATARGNDDEAGYNPGFALVDMNRIFKEYGKTKDAEAKINASKEEAKKSYDKRADSYKKALDEINELNRQLALSTTTASSRQKLERERDDKIASIRKMESEINEFRTAREKDLKDQALKMRAEIVAEMTGTIKQLGSNAADVILDYNGMSLNGVAFIVHSPPGADMSDRVIAALNKKGSSEFASTQDLKIASIDMNDVFKRFDKTKASEAKVNEAKAAAKKEYDSRADNYKKELADVNGLSGDARDSQVSKVKEMERQINNWRTTREKEIQDQALKLRTEIVSEINGALKARLPANEAILVFDKSGTTMNGVPAILSSSKVPDLSDQIVASLNNTGKKSRSRAASKPDFALSSELRFACVDVNRAYQALPETKKAEAEIADLKKKTVAAGKTEDAKEVRDAALEKRNAIVQKLATGIRQIAQAGNYSITFDSSGNSLNGVPFVIRNVNLPDVTNDVISNMSVKSQ
ncbi:MAG: outer membrane protein [Verrucomicrobiota bacterium]